MTRRLRRFQLADHEAVNALHRAVAWPERSLAGWRWLFDNPARQGRNPARAAGWVVDGPQGLGAFLGNFAQTLWVGGEARSVATGFSIIVAPGLKGASRLLIDAFMDQPDTAVAYTLNANPLSSPILTRRGMRPFPPATAGLKLSWRTDSLATLAGRIGRLAADWAPGLGGGGEWLMNRRLEARPPSLTLDDDIQLLNDLSDRSAYAAFWDRLKRESAVIMDRSPATLRWRLADPDQLRRPLLLARRQGDSITGLGWAMLSKDDARAAPALDIIDLVALDQDPQARRRLLQAFIDNARRVGAAKVRLQAVNPALLDALGPLGRAARHEGGWGHCHARINPASPMITESWKPTPFDGDYTVCLRPAPVPVARQAQAAYRGLDRLSAPSASP